MYRTGELFQDRKLFMYVIIAIVMSGYDAVATMQHISRGVAAEGNPLMDSLIQQHALLFFLVKMTITAFGLMVCYRFSKLRTARFGIRLVVILYSLVCMYHVMIILFE